MNKERETGNKKSQAHLRIVGAEGTRVRVQNLDGDYNDPGLVDRIQRFVEIHYPGHEMVDHETGQLLAALRPEQTDPHGGGEAPRQGSVPFQDPETGEEIDSTWLGRFAARSGCNMLLGLGMGLGMGLFAFSIAGWKGLFFGLLGGLGFGLCGALLNSLSVHLYGRGKWARFLAGGKWGWTLIEYERGNSGIADRIHDAVARAQHRRRQRILRSQEHQHVPDGALSRAQPPGEPEPTGAALSRTDRPDEAGHLAIGIEEDRGVDRVEKAPP